MSPAMMDMHGGDLSLFEAGEEDLLFAPDSFEDLKASAQQREHASSSSYNNQQQEYNNSNNIYNQQHSGGGLGNTNSNSNNSNNELPEDDEDFSALVSMNNQSAPISSEDVNISNMDAWGRSA